jgi:hypothetical protein
VDGVEITLLSYAVADDTLRIHGAIRVKSPHEARLAGVPDLELRQVGDAVPMPSLGARVLPSPPLVWLTWLFALPGPEPGSMTARIEQLMFGYRTGSKADIVTGPWVFDGIGARGDGSGHLAADRGPHPHCADNRRVRTPST